jgi:dTDP-4-amino-4,6-dideoxygalactose transaminase
MNEMQAAFGLLELRYVDGAIARRRELDTIYPPGTGRRARRRGAALGEWQHNYGYFPIFVAAALPARARTRLRTGSRMKGIFGRRYFYPLISEFRCTAVSLGRNRAAAGRARIAERVLCLPALSRPHRRAGARRDPHAVRSG